jgi:CHAD domain-containing protein
MKRALAEASRVQEYNRKAGARREAPRAAKAVHGLRVALRRCRTIAAGLEDVDPDPQWKRMKRAAGRLFDAYGRLRDVQVMRDWLAKLAAPGDALGIAVQARLEEQEKQTAAEAGLAARRFDRKQWKEWSGHLAGRVKRIPPGGLVFQHVALRAWQEAHELHRTALRRRSRVAWHQLRIGVKRFRYAVENFLPEQHAAWGRDLKRMQDLLGEVHDLDVLWEALKAERAPEAARARPLWRALIDQERATRLGEYRRRTTGAGSLWQKWREGLPEGPRLELAALAWLRSWAGFQDPDARRRRMLVSVALQLFDGMAAAGVHVTFRDARARRIVYGAALTQHVGRPEGFRGHHKAAFRLIRDVTPPIGWSPRDMLWTALVARYHRGAEPRPAHEGYASLPPADQQAVAWLGGVLRLADALTGCRPPVNRVRVESSGAIHVWAHGLSESAPERRVLDERKHLLEVVSHRPVMIHAAANGKARLAG